MKTRSLIVMMIAGLMIIGQGFVSGAFARGPMMQRTTAATTTDTTAAPTGMPDHGPGQGQMDRPPLDVLSGEAITVAGTITEITSGQRMKDDVKINTGSEVITVCGFGPAQYWTDSGFTFPMVGDSITVNGYKVTAPDNTQIIIAAKVTIGGKELQLVDTTTGKPLFQPKGEGPGHGQIDILSGTAVTITGTITEISALPGPDEVRINTGAEVVTVCGLGPAEYWTSLGFTRPLAGDAVTVDGYKVTLSDGSQKIFSAKITVGSNQVQLIDAATGRPLWMGKGNRT